MGKRYALLLGVGHYVDERLQKLESPEADIKGLGKVFADPEIGNFDFVETFLDLDSVETKRTINNFFSHKKVDDLVVVYFSGHGIVDTRGNLFLATKDTSLGQFRKISLSTKFLLESMEGCYSQKQVLILDCCFSGAFARNTKIGLGQIAVNGESFQGDGRGKVVLTATDATQYAWDGNSIIGKSEKSLFTHYLVEGLRSGLADLNNDNEITLDELYDYIFNKVTKYASIQYPKKWVYSQEGKGIVLGYAQRVVRKKIASFSLDSAMYEHVAVSPTGKYVIAVKKYEPKIAIIDTVADSAVIKKIKLEYRNFGEKIFYSTLDLLSGTLTNGVEVSSDGKYLCWQTNGTRILELPSLRHVAHIGGHNGIYLSANELLLDGVGCLYKLDLNTKQRNLLYKLDDQQWTIWKFQNYSNNTVGILLRKREHQSQNDKVNYFADIRVLILDLKHNKLVQDAYFERPNLGFEIAVSPDGKKLAINNYHYIDVKDVETLNELYSLPKEDFYGSSIQFINDEILAVHDNKQLKFYRENVLLKDIQKELDLDDSNEDDIDVQVENMKAESFGLNNNVFACIYGASLSIWEITSALSGKSIFEL